MRSNFPASRRGSAGGVTGGSRGVESSTHTLVPGIRRAEALKAGLRFGNGEATRFGRGAAAMGVLPDEADRACRSCSSKRRPKEIRSSADMVA